MDISEMNELQKKAFNIYVDSATKGNNYTPISYNLLADALISDGEKCSKSSVARWGKKWKWINHLNKDLQESQNSNSSITSKLPPLDSDNIFSSNERIISSSYSIILAQLEKYEQKVKEGIYLTATEEKFILRAMRIVTEREDKLLDRQALLSTAKLVGSTDVLKALNEVIIEVENDDD